MSDSTNSAADAFEAVGNEYRVEILRSMMTAYQNNETPISFSDLMESIGLRDSGKFNYHLQKLVGRFICDTGDGYALTYAGRTAVSAIASGKLNDDSFIERESVDGACYACGERALILHYPGQRVRVTCESCDEELVHIQFPPTAVSKRTVDELKRDFDRWARSWRSLVGGGICPECNGKVSGQLRLVESPETTPTVGNLNIRAVISCDGCWVRGAMPPGLLVITHPAIVSAFWDHGIDIYERPLWQHHWALSQDYLTVINEEPLRVEIEVPIQEDTVSLRIDRSLSVDQTY